MSDEAKKARRRALRAAKVATLGLALAGAGCYANHGVTPEPSAADAAPASTDAAVPDLGGDAGPDLFAADAGAGCAVDESWTECCERVDWACDESNSWGCCAWGPYVPPAEGALPPSREQV